MAGYTKLFSSIIASTIWRADDKTRIVWITMLAMSDQFGIVEGSVPGLADMARVTVDECRDALAALQAPDEDSRSKEQDGRRIEPVDGGWRLINHGKYRDKMSLDERREYQRLYQRNYRKRPVNTDPDKLTKFDIQNRTEAEQKQNNVRTEEAEANASGLTFPTISKPSTWTLTQEQFDGWVSLFPGLDVQREIAMAVTWIDGNPSKRKTAKGMPRFLSAWLIRASNDQPVKREARL